MKPGGLATHKVLGFSSRQYLNEADQKSRDSYTAQGLLNA